MNKLFHDAPGDRLVTDIYAWVVTDHRTGLEGLFAMSTPMGLLQAATSSPAVADHMGEIIGDIPYADKTFRLVKFTKAEVVRTL